MFLKVRFPWKFFHILADLPGLMDLAIDSMFWVKSDGLTVTHITLTIHWHLGCFFTLVLDEGCFNIFENKNKPNWSLFISQVQIGKFQINAWLALATLPCVGWWFLSLIFGLVIVSINKKYKFTFLVFLVKSKKPLIWKFDLKKKIKENLICFLSMLIREKKEKRPYLKFSVSIAMEEVAC